MPPSDAPATPPDSSPGATLVARRAGDLPALTFLGPLLAEAEEQGLAAAVAVRSAGADHDKATAKRRHDLKAALRTLGFTVSALQGGYRFDDVDERRDAKITAIAKAVAVLTKESELTLALLGES